MNVRPGQHSYSAPGDLLAGFSELLLDRRQEIETAILTRVHSISDPGQTGDPSYVSGLHAAVSAGLGYVLTGIQRSDYQPGPIPAELFAQARHAARSGVSFDTVLRRYVGGHALLADFIVQGAEASHLGAAELKRILRIMSVLLDHLLAAIAEEYNREAAVRPRSGDVRRTELVKRLLAALPADTSNLGYELDGWHLGIAAVGPAAEETVRALTAMLDRRILLVSPEEEAVWAWLGGRNRVEADQVLDCLGSTWPSELALAIGEPGRGLPGWRLTHRQALAALPIASQRSQSPVRYVDVVLPASMLTDDLLITSLRQIFLAPLSEGRDGGEVLRETLRAYFAADRNVSSAAAALTVNRQTVANRLHAVEERLGRPLSNCAAEVETALSLDRLVSPVSSGEEEAG